MRARWIAVLLVTLVALPASAKPPGKGFWKILVKPNAKWVMVDRHATVKKGEQPDRLTVTTYDVRKVGDADVARLRWSYNDADKDDNALATTHALPLTQIAVTSAGVYLLTADMDDAKVAAALKQKPSRSDPPKPYKATKLNQGRYLEIRGDLVCLGQGPAPDDPPCEDTCAGEVCISETDGIVLLEGTWSPNWTQFEKPKPGRK